MSELKPCPFCGSEVEIVPEGDYHEIHCDVCQCSMWAEERKHLEKTWNTREGMGGK